MSGVECLRSFAAWSTQNSSRNINEEMLIVGMSANATTREQDEAFDCGMHLYLSKPLNMEYVNLILNERRKHPSIISLTSAFHSSKLLRDMQSNHQHCTFRMCRPIIRSNKQNNQNNHISTITDHITGGGDTLDTTEGKIDIPTTASSSSSYTQGILQNLYSIQRETSGSYKEDCKNSSDEYSNNKSANLNILKELNVLILDTSMYTGNVLKSKLESLKCHVNIADRVDVTTRLLKEQTFDIFIIDFLTVYN